jgi:endonuclease YncB( thermonuclease family)
MVGAPLRVVAFFFLLVVALAMSLGGFLPTAARAQEQATTVKTVVDGDTVEISPAIGGNDEVRLIGVDTPETVDRDSPVQPYGPEASRFTTRELEGERVRLEFDEDREDDLGRLLAYVRVGGGGAATFNETLLSQGYAQLWVIPPNDRYEARFRQAQQQAKGAGRGIWGLARQQQCQLANHGNGVGEGSPDCGGATPQPEPQNPAPQQPTPEGKPEKGPDPKKAGQRGVPTLPETGGLPLAPLTALPAVTAGVVGASILRRS